MGSGEIKHASASNAQNASFSNSRFFEKRETLAENDKSGLLELLVSREADASPLRNANEKNKELNSFLSLLFSASAENLSDQQLLTRHLSSTKDEKLFPRSLLEEEYKPKAAPTMSESVSPA